MTANPRVVAAIVKSLAGGEGIAADATEQRVRLADNGFRAGKQSHLHSWHWCIDNGLIEFGVNSEMYALTPLGKTYLDWFMQREARV